MCTDTASEGSAVGLSPGLCSSGSAEGDADGALVGPKGRPARGCDFARRHRLRVTEGPWKNFSTISGHDACSPPSENSSRGFWGRFAFKSPQLDLSNTSEI